MQNLSPENMRNEEAESASLLERFLGTIMGKKVEKPNLEAEEQEVKDDSRRKRADLSLDQLSDEVDEEVDFNSVEKPQKKELVSAEGDRIAQKFNLLKKGFLLLQGSEFREEFSRLDKKAQAKMVFNEMYSLEKKQFLEVWDDSEGVIETVKNYFLWVVVNLFSKTKAGKEIFTTVDQYGGVYNKVKGGVDTAVENAKEALQTAKQIKMDNKAAAVMLKTAPGEIAKFLKTPNKSGRIIERLKEWTQNSSFQKLVAKGKVKGLTLSKKVGMGGVIILAAEKLKELITTGEVSLDEEKSFFENWVFDGKEFAGKFENLLSSVRENGALNSKLATAEFSFEVFDLALTGVTLFSLGAILFTSLPLTLGATFLSALWLFLRKGSLSALKKLIPKIGLAISEKFGKKGAKTMLKKAVKSGGAKRVGKSVVIQTGLQVALDKGISFVNTTVLSAAKKVGKKVGKKAAAAVLSVKQRVILRKVAGVEI